MENKKKVNNVETSKKKDASLKGIFSSSEVKESLSEDNWTQSINSLKEKKFSKLSVAVDAVVDEVILKLNIEPTSDLKVFLYDLCTDSPKIMNSIEKELL